MMPMSIRAPQCRVYSTMTRLDPSQPPRLVASLIVQPSAQPRLRTLLGLHPRSDDPLGLAVE
jgi:hypothetical protein